MAQKYKITYRDLTTQVVSADSYATENGWVNFYDIDGQVHSAPAGDVQSVSRDGVEARTDVSIGIA